MFPLKSLGLVLTACIYATATRQSSSNLRDDCEFTLDGSRYDLCPLFRDRGQDGVVNVRAESIDLLYGMSFGARIREVAEPRVSAGECTVFYGRK